MDPLLKLLDQKPPVDWPWHFEPDADGPRAVNAVALCNVALLAYSDPDGVDGYLDGWHFSDRQFLDGPRTRGYLGLRDDAIFIAFRGTEPANLADWLCDANYRQSSLSAEVPGQVHSGFASSTIEIVKPLLAGVAKLTRGRKRRIFLTGHSLGGAIAVLAAAMLQPHHHVTAVYTYGQPRVGDSAFSAAYDQILGQRTFRYVNDKDIVPHLPPPRLLGIPLPRAPKITGDLLADAKANLADARRTIAAIVDGHSFTHVGLLKLLMPDGTLTGDPLAWQQREAIDWPNISDVRDLPARLRKRFFQPLSAHNRILDHDPLNGYLKRLQALRQ